MLLFSYIKLSLILEMSIAEEIKSNDVRIDITNNSKIL